VRTAAFFAFYDSVVLTRLFFFFFSIRFLIGSYLLSCVIACSDLGWPRISTHHHTDSITPDAVYIYISPSHALM
jgi:hypothetical protein